MIVEQLLDGMAVIWTPSAVIAAVLGGIAVGWAVEAMSPTRQWKALGVIVFALGTLSMLVFWSGQIVDETLSGDPSWSRAVGRGTLQWLFVLVMALSAAFGRWRDSHQTS